MIDVASAATRMADMAQEELQFSCVSMAADLSPLCESNIELMLLMAFELMNFFYVGPGGRPVSQIVRDGVTCDPAASSIMIEPQFQWGKYRIDFRIAHSGLEMPIFVECDGHDFHERTKEQAERDRSKDRAIQEAGIPILRFTGREIYRSPFGVANQILAFVVSRLKAKQA